MTADELYAEIKAALRYFELAFSEMPKMQVTLRDNSVEFHHDGRTVVVRIDPNV